MSLQRERSVTDVTLVTRCRVYFDGSATVVTLGIRIFCALHAHAGVLVSKLALAEHKYSPVKLLIRLYDAQGWSIVRTAALHAGMVTTNFPLSPLIGSVFGEGSVPSGFTVIPE
jgi:hypothetical protein